MPQFHSIPENDEWWGKGFTEWTNVKKSVPLYNGHNQPRIPLDNNYYDLSDWHVLKQQALLAKKYGIYVFCFYHYWFGEKMLLQKPMENLLAHPEIDINYCISWANESWTNAWVSNNKKVLIQQTYGDENEWKKHFEYLYQFFSDSRYIKEDGCPFIVIYRPENIECLSDMISCWRKLAIQSGFNGLRIAYQHVSYHVSKNEKSLFDYGIEYQPVYAMRDIQTRKERILAMAKERISYYLQKKYGRAPEVKRNQVIQIDYKKVWDAVINRHGTGEVAMIPGAFVDWDNTPRRGMKGTAFIGSSPQAFGYYFNKQIQNAKQNYHTDKLFIFAWNERAEGGYLEPDEKYKYSYLEAIKNALDNCGELET